MSNEKKRGIRQCGGIFLLLYVSVLMYVFFFAKGYGRVVDADRVYRYNLRPFLEIRRFWVYQDLLGKPAFYANVLGNVLCFVPLGFILPLLFARIDQFALVGITGFLCSLMVECVQLVTKVGCFDVDDLLLNTIGAMMGYLCFSICNQFRRKYYG